MSTKNPKVSAYVPKALKDCVEKLAKERNISESQLVTIILAEYFQIPEVLGRSPETGSVGGVTLARMEALEQEFSNFAKSLEQRLQELAESINKSSELQVDQSRPKEEVIDTQQGVDQVGKPPTTSESIQLEFLQIKEANGSSLLNEPPVKAEETEEKNELYLSLQSEPLSELQEEIKPIPGTKLSELRFERGKDTIAGAKRKLSLEKFTEWTIEQDPDDIAWKYVESPIKGYVPANELSGELKRKLLIWIEKNIN